MRRVADDDQGRAVPLRHGVWDQQDRRTLHVEMTDAAKQAEELLFGPLAKEGLTLLQTYTAQELSAVLRYLEDGRQFQRAHAQRIRDLGDADVTSARRARGRRATRSTTRHRRRK